MNRNGEQGSSEHMNWDEELLKAIFTWTIGRALDVLMKLISRRLMINKRPLLTFVGLVYTGGLVLVFLVWLAGTYATVTGPYTQARIVGYLTTTWGLLIAIGVSGLGFNRLAHRVDPSHWTARMTAGLRWKSGTGKVVSVTPSYIQQLPPIQPFER
jgi:hypothetical protein